MKIFSIIAKIWKKERICAVPVLSFENYKVKRACRIADATDATVQEFGEAYLTRARAAMRGEYIPKEARAFARRALADEKTQGTDEFDEIFCALNSLGGLNVTEREFYGRRGRKL